MAPATSSRSGPIHSGSTMCGTGVDSRSTFAPAPARHLLRLGRELRRDHGIERAVRDRDRDVLEARRVERPPLDTRHEPGHRNERSRARTVGAEAHRVAHDRPLREAAEHDALDRHREVVEKRGETGRRLVERRRIGCRDPAERVPVPSAGREAVRAARRDPEQPPVRVEQVEERIQVVLVGPAPVEQHERARRSPRRLAPVRCERRIRHADHVARGAGSGVRAGSIRARRCSKAGGRMRASPRCSGSSSTPKPGPTVASSKRTPLGSRK